MEAFVLTEGMPGKNKLIFPTGHRAELGLAGDNHWGCTCVLNSEVPILCLFQSPWLPHVAHSVSVGTGTLSSLECTDSR